MATVDRLVAQARIEDNNGKWAGFPRRRER
jgi:hypothetical protein